MQLRQWAYAAALCAAAHVHAQPTAPADTIEVIGTTPLGGATDPSRVAANVQTATAEEIREQGTLDLAEYMRRNFGSVFVNDAQSNPLQPDVQYRGFVGSPLLGLPQGLAVYEDAVRINEPFGDTVNWALIPESAIDTVQLVPGSNPLFGLNALGGAISIRTKNGFSNPGTRAQVEAGSFGRVTAQGETGGSTDGGLGYFVTGSAFHENGWRDFSPSSAAQIFAALSSTFDTGHVDATFTHADTDLIGNGASPADLLAIDRHAVFTRPDRTRNHLNLLNVSAEQRFTPRQTASGNLYVRDSRTDTLNGDNSDYFECAGSPALLCMADGGGEALVLDTAGMTIASTTAVGDAVLNRTHTAQRSIGFGAQWQRAGRLSGGGTDVLVGLAHDRSTVDYTAATELGRLDATRLAVPGGIFVGDGSTNLGATIDSTGVFASGSVAVGQAATIILSGRFNRTSIALEDRLGTALNGAHTFTRFNPAVGLTVRLGAATSFYAGYSEANRAPSPVELTCADAEAPCRLPNAFVADPPLEQVVAATVETGVRGQWRSGSWHAGLFRATNRNDILFISAGALTNEGYFDNVGATRRQGLEIDVDGSLGERLHWFSNYTQLDATFRDAFTVASPHNPAATAGEIFVQVGDRLPLVPSDLLKVGLSARVGAHWTIGADAIGTSSQYLRGDEANLTGKLSGYGVLNLRAEWELSRDVRLFANLDNALDARYETFGLFGSPGDVLGPGFDDPRFLGPGAPRGLWMGVRIALD